MAMVSFVDADRQWFKSQVGVEGIGTRREDAFCAHAIADGQDVLVVPDAHQDPRFSGNPFVLGEPHVRFYAGHVVREPSGLPVGTICVLDRRPRAFSDADRSVLADLAAMRLMKRKPGQRGPGKRPALVSVTLRLEQDTVAAYKASGAGWQGRMRKALREAAKVRSK